MSTALSKRISIFLLVNKETIKDYFNPHDPAPLYKRQLRQDFIQYLDEDVKAYKKYSTLRYKVTCKEEDKELVEPLMNAIRRYYHTKELVKRSEFNSFKKSSFRLLIAAMLLVLTMQGVIEFAKINGTRMESVLHNYADVFSWVVMWQPIYRLVFMWNPYKKEISLLHKLANADAIIIKNAEQETLEVAIKLRVSA